MTDPLPSAIDIYGAGAFGTALAIAYAQAGLEVGLWARNPEPLMTTRSSPRLPGQTLPDSVRVSGDPDDFGASIALITVPTQQLNAFLETGLPMRARYLISCSKGLHRGSGRFPADLIATRRPEAVVAQLTGPSFAADIAAGLPTALTLACADDEVGAALQQALSTDTLRLYRTTDLVGAELGGALKNVIAIATGAVIGAGLGESARAALIARGFAEMRRYATARGAALETLTGLSGLGDLVLTCGSEMSRNFRFGHALAQGAAWPEDVTVEGVHTARELANGPDDTPIADTVAALADGRLDIAGALGQLLMRPLKPE